MKRYALIKNGELLYITDSIPTKQTYLSEKEYKKVLDSEQEKIDAMTTEELLNYQEPSNVKITGIDYDEAIEFYFDGKPILQNGEIIEDQSEKIARRQELKVRIWNLITQKSGMVELGEDITDIEAEITALKEEYKAL